MGEVTRDSGADDELRNAPAAEEDELGLELPLRLLSEADTIDAEVVGRFLLDTALRAPTLLEEASSGKSGMPADFNCG